MRATLPLPVILLLPALGACLDREPPTLSVNPVDRARPHRGSIEITGEVADPSGLASVSLSVDGGEPVEIHGPGPFAHTLDTRSLPDGAHLVEVIAVDDSSGANRATAAVALATDNSPPALEIAERSLAAAQGGVLPVFVRTAEVLHEPKVRFLDREYPLYAVSATGYRALIGVSVKTEPGKYPLTVEATDAVGNVGQGTVEVALAETPFVRGGFVELSKKQEETQKDDTKQKFDRDIREAAWAHVEPRQLWAGPMLRPTEGSISSEFGKFREYSSGLRTHHLGLDLSNEPGTPVYAANDGEVLVAEPLFIMGNHVVVGHGHGVASAYSHLTEIAVKKGERVHKGQLVGTLGSTGQSTGPHLHWEVVVGGEKIDPAPWERETFDLSAELVFVPVPTTGPASEVAHGKPGEDHPVQGRPHHGGDHATVDHSFADAEKWSAIFDDPARDTWQKPAELVAALKIAPGSTIADIGAGTGYFNPHLSRAVGPEGAVVAIDIEQSLVDWMKKRAERDGTPNVEPRLGTAADPGLKPAEVDLVLLVDTYHHIGGRVEWFRRLREGVKPGGRLVIVDFQQGDIPVGPPEGHRIPEEKVVAELTEAGWTDAGSIDVLPWQFVRVMTRTP